MAKATIEVGLDEFLMQLRDVLAYKAKRTSAGMFDGVVIPADLVDWILVSCDKFLALQEAEEKPLPLFE